MLRVSSTIILGLLFIFACLALILVPDVLRETISDMLSLAVILSYVALVILSIGGVVVVAYGTWHGAERILSMRAGRHKKEHEAAIVPITAPVNQQVWVHESNGAYRNLSLEARVLVAEDRLPTEAEIQAWVLWQSFHATANRGAIAAGQELLDVVQPVDLLSHIRNVQRCLIVGSSDAGKTTLLKHIATERAGSSHVLVIDPHAGPATWPADVIGRGSDHAAISKVLDGLLALMEQRYNEIGDGKMREGEHRRLTVIVDEWMSIEEQCQNAARVFGRLIREARKAGIDTFVGSHSDRVASLGLTGKGDLRDGLEIIRLHYNQWTGERSATITIKHANGEKEIIPAILPGEFHNGVWQVSQPSLELPGPELSEIEQQILSMHADGLSVSAIAEKVFGSKGGNQNSEVKRILNKFQERSKYDE